MNEYCCYFLSNDRDIYWAEQLLSSYLTHNSTTIKCVPFDNNIEKLTKLCSKYSIPIIIDDEFFEWCDNLYLQLPPPLWDKDNISRTSIGYLRKLYVFLKSKYEKSMFLDSDIIVLQDLTPLFNTNDDVTFFSKTDIQYCYNDEFIDKYGDIIGSHHYNSGGFVCKSNLFSKSVVESLIQKQKQIGGFRTSHDQSIINQLTLSQNINVGCNNSMHWPCGKYKIQSYHYMIHLAGPDCKKQFLSTIDHHEM